jgi:hypothetical protein
MTTSTKTQYLTIFATRYCNLYFQSAPVQKTEQTIIQKIQQQPKTLLFAGTIDGLARTFYSQSYNH